MNRMKTNRPSNKVIATALAAALTTIVIAVVKAIWPVVEITSEVQGAITTVLIFLVGYYTPPGNADQVVMG